MVSDTTPAFVAAYTLSPGTGPSPDSEAMLTMSPPAGPNASSAARIPNVVPSRFTPTSRWTDSEDSSPSAPSSPTPALLTHTRSGAWPPASAATSACEPSSRTSWPTPATAPTSREVRRAASASTSVTTTA